MPAPEQVTSRWRRVPFGGLGSGLFKLAVSATLMTLVLRRFSFQELKEQILGTHAPALVLPFVILLASHLLAALQWKGVLRSTGLAIGFGRVARLYGIGLFFNQFMLGSVGGDVYKVYGVRRTSGDLERAAGATIVDRWAGMAALCVLASGAALVGFRSGDVPGTLVLWVAVVSLGFLVGSAALLRQGFPVVATAARRLGASSPRIALLLDQLRAFRGRTRLLRTVFLMSLFIQGSRVLAHFCVGLAMGWSLHPSDLGKFFLVIPILGLLVTLPISIGGWGVREWMGAVLFTPLGHDGEEAVTLLAMTAALTFAVGLLGAGAFLFELWRRPERAVVS